MRQTCIGAMGSNARARLTHPHAWILALSLALLCAPTGMASALSDPRTNRHFTKRDKKFQPGPSTKFVLLADSGSPAAVPSALRSETYWTAFADQDLTTLRQMAESNPEARFADGMTLLASGNQEDAEQAFRTAGAQSMDLNVAIAAQVMLAKTLRYERKWSELRDLSQTSRLSASDQKLTTDLESWGKAFAGTEREATTFPRSPTQLRLKMSAISTPTIRVRINGKQYDFWIDTGSSMTVISSSVADDADIRALTGDTLTVRTFAGSAPVRPAVVKRLEIGSIVIANSPAVIIDESLMYLRASSPGFPANGVRVDGIIGWDTICQFDLTMDYAAGTITLAEPDRHAARNHLEQNLVWFGKPFVVVHTESGASLHFTVDTGAQTSFLSADAIEKAGATSRISANRVFGIARSGRETDRVVRALSIEVGGKSMQLENVIVSGPLSSGLINCDGILGSDIARYGTIHIDATNGRFTIGDSRRGENRAE